MKPAVLGLILFGLCLSTPLFAKNKGGDRVQFFQSIYVEHGEETGDLVCIMCSIHTEGTTRGDIVAVGGSIDANGQVKGDTVAVGGGLRLGSETSVGGDAVAVGGGIWRDSQARVRGEVTEVSPLGHSFVGTGMLGLFLLSGIGLVPIGIAAALLTYLALGPRRVEVMANALMARAGMAFLIGFGVLIAFVVLIVFSFKMGPAAPWVSLAASLLFGLLVIAGYTGVSYWMGRRTSQTASAVGAVLLGALIVGLIEAIPLAGAFAIVLFFLFAAGSAALTGFGSEPDWLERRMGGHPQAQGSL